MDKTMNLSLPNSKKKPHLMLSLAESITKEEKWESWCNDLVKGGLIEKAAEERLNLLYQQRETQDIQRELDKL